MKIGIVGMRECGKSTLFRALTGRDEQVASKKPYSIGVVRLPDKRLDRLFDICKPRSEVSAEVVFLDFHTEEYNKAIDPQIVQQIKDSDALVLVLRGFEDPCHEGINPLSEWQEIQTEFILSDLEIVERKLGKLCKEAKMEFKRQIPLFERLKACLEEGRSLKELGLTKEELTELSGYRFLSLLPMIVVLNISEDDLGIETADLCLPVEDEIMSICAKVEAEIASLEEEERDAFLTELGISESALNRFIKSCYSLLSLISFFTVGEDEVRAWTITEGTSAYEAAGKIHSDIQRGFIRAEVMDLEDFIKYGSEKALKDAGRFRLEGKNYIIHDGEIVHYRFNV